ncbi:MAG: hypothetical protein V7K67_29715 [Nostoc sp.]|uniref:PspA/IM30 family protein n=1 Tax=Nostoc sp. TaxID=1180 RepID=UPI002FFBA250
MPVPCSLLSEGVSHSRVAQEIAQRDYAKAQAEADKWEQEYQLALKGSNQDLISQAKFQKERYQAIASRLKKLVGEQQPQVDAIKSSLKSWEQKVSEAQNKVLSSKGASCFGGSPCAKAHATRTD